MKTAGAPRIHLAGAVLAAALLCRCASAPATAPDGDGDAGTTDATDGKAEVAVVPDPFADRVVSFAPGPGATFGHGQLPAVVLGPPHGAGAGGGSLHVASLGQGGEIVLEFLDIEAIDGPGPDLLVFENPFSTWLETGVVAASADGVAWHEWPCASADQAGGFPGCAGVTPVLAAPGNGVDPTDPQAAGGDAFDLAAVGLQRARFVRIRDTGLNPSSPPGGGFDLDAIAVVNGAPIGR